MARRYRYEHWKKKRAREKARAERLANQSDMERSLREFLGWVIYILIVVAIPKITNNKVTIGGYRIFRIISESMVPVYNINDVILVKVTAEDGSIANYAIKLNNTNNSSNNTPLCTNSNINNSNIIILLIFSIFIVFLLSTLIIYIRNNKKDY